MAAEHVLCSPSDNETTARTVGEMAGVGEVRAELLPEDKASVVVDHNEEYSGVAMIEDGGNDAPALAIATVG